MAGIITKNFRLHNTAQFKEQFSEAAATNIYLFVGRNRSWPDDNNPPTPTEVLDTVEYDIWNNMLAMKRVNASDVSYAAPRIDWTTGTVYAQYTATTVYSDVAQYYVVTEDYNVYKCISNNLGAQSTVKPTGTLTTVFSTADGYKWKFMFAVSAADAIKFLTTTYIPVNTLTGDNGSSQWTVQQAAANGSIETISVTNAGSAYKSHSGTLAAGGTTTVTLAAGAEATDDVYNYSSIYIASGTGAGQVRRIVNYVGSTKVATVSVAFSPATDTSSVYILGPTVNITGDGSSLAAYANVHSGALRYVNVINTGNNYSYANVTISANGSWGTGATAVAQMSPKGGHGKDATAELFAHNLILNVKLTGTESSTFFTSNDFRILGLVADPVANGAVASAASYRMTKRYVVTSPVGTPTADEIFTGGSSGATGYFVERANTTVLFFTGGRGTFTPAETITGGSSGATATVSSVIHPLVSKYTGKVLYFENRAPIARASDQAEDIKLITRF